MPPKLAFVRDIVPGRIDWKMKVRVIRLWTVPDFMNPEHTNSIEMVLSDEMGGRIHATIKKSLVLRFKELLNEGLAYVLQNLLVAQADSKFRTTKHKYKLNFMGSTTITETATDKIPIITFQFVPFADIINGGDESLLIDVIGHVVEKDMLKETEKNGKKSRLIEFVLEDLEKNKVNCTLWGQFADEMSEFLANDQDTGPIIVILQFCKIKPYNGRVGISNAYHGSKLLINPNLKEDVDYKEKLINGEESYSQIISQMSVPVSMSVSDDLLQTDRMTIADIIESTEECVGSVLAKILEIETEDNWWYEACSKCLRKAEPVGRKYYCDKCEKLVVAVPRFRIQVKVIDQTGSTSFVMFDRVVSQVISRTAAEIIEASTQENNNNNPADFDAFVEKEFLFKVEIGSLNIKNSWPVYTVKKITADEDIIRQFRSRYSITGNEEEEDIDPTGNAGVQVADNLKDFGSNELEITPSSKIPKKRAADEVVVCSLSDDGASQLSSNKVMKNIKLE